MPESAPYRPVRAFGKRPKPRGKTLKIETYENKITCRCCRAFRSGKLVCSCRSFFQLFIPCAVSACSRGKGDCCGSRTGYLRAACCLHTSSDRGHSALSDAGLCVGAGLLVGLWPRSRLGDWMLAGSGALCFCASLLWASLWLASLRKAAAAFPCYLGPVFNHVSGLGMGGTGRHGRAYIMCALPTGVKNHCAKGI